MRYDARLIKDAVQLDELFRRDGCELRRAGPDDLVCKCPFHEEKTASCHVHPAKQFFKCFGCGEGGDCFKYWELTRHVEFGEAIRQLANLTNGQMPASSITSTSRSTSTRKEEEPLASRMEGEHLESWVKGVERLRDRPDTQERIASWRGYDVATIKWANELGLIGLVPMYGEWRESFLVERPDEHDYEHEHDLRIPVGYHVRLGPRTAGNQYDKASWRYVPAGIGAWPFVIGDVTRATALFLLEGQWDALALIDAMGWSASAKATADSSGSTLPAKVAVIGMRGATSTKRFLEHFTWSDEAVGFAIADADAAGRGWFAEDGFLNALRDRCKRVFGFMPSSLRAGSKDFNDVWKARAVTREQLTILFREKMRHPTRGRRPRGPTFLQFCRAQRDREDAVGAAARLICKDKMYRPVGRKPFKVWERYLRSHVPEEQHPAVRQAWREWVNGNFNTKVAKEAKAA